MIDTSGVALEIIKDSESVIREISQQPRIWREVWELVQQQESALQNFIQGHDVILFTGAGTSEFVGNSIYRSFYQRKEQILSIGTTDLISHPYYYLDPDKKILLVSCARSGNSPESMASVELADQVCSHIDHLFITCNPNGKLAQYAKNNDHTYLLLMPEGTNDASFAMTSSYTAMVLAALLIFGTETAETKKHSVEKMADAGNDILEEYGSKLRKLVKETAFERLVYLGGGTLKGVAQESALKALEVTAGKLSTMYESPLGYRHGPSSFVKTDDHNLIVMYFENDAYANRYAMDMLKEMKEYHKQNSCFIALCTHDEQALHEVCDTVIVIDGKDVPSAYLTLPYVMVAQMLAVYRSWDYGIGSDYPFGHDDSDVGIKTVIYPYVAQVGK